MMRTLSMLLAALLLAVPALPTGADEKDKQEPAMGLEELARRCEEALARKTAPPPPRKHQPQPEPRKGPPPPEKEPEGAGEEDQALAKFPLLDRRKMAYEMARELMGGEQKDRKELAELLRKLKVLNVPGSVVALHPLFFGRNGEKRHFAWEAARHYVREGLGEHGYDPGKPMAAHSPPHLAIRRWMMNDKAVKDDPWVKQIVANRLKHAKEMLRKLDGTSQKQEAEELARLLREQGEEWVASPLVGMALTQDKQEPFVRKFAWDSASSFVGLGEMKWDFNPRAMKRPEGARPWQAANQKVSNFVKECPYCTAVVNARD